MPIVKLLSTTTSNELRPAADAIWKAIQQVKDVSDSDIADALIAQVAKSTSVGPVFFYESSPKNVINMVDYTKELNDIGIWIMGYAISSDKNFNNIDGAGCKAKLVPTFQNKQLAADLFLEYLYHRAGFEAFALYEKKDIGVEVLNMILGPDFIPQDFWMHSANMFPCQVLLLLAKNWGCDLEEVRARLKAWGVTASVFNMADGEYNFFDTFVKQPDSSFFAYIDSNQNIQTGLATTRPKTAGVALCNVWSRSVWGEITYTRGYPTPGGLDPIPDHWDQDINNVYGEQVANWVSETTNLPHSDARNNIVFLKSIRLEDHKPNGFPVGSTADPDMTRDFSGCFPGNALVVLSTGQRAPISSLRHGDRVLTVDEEGRRKFSEVFFFGHRDHDKVAQFKRLCLDGDNCLRLTAGHYVTVSNTLSWKDARFARAGEVVEGQYVWVLPEDTSNDEPQPSRVIAIEDCECVGLFNPYTLDASTIVVDGVLASPHSEWFLEDIAPGFMTRYIPVIYDVCMFPGRLVYRLMGPAWAETLQNEVPLDKAAYSETGLRSLVKPYMMLAEKVIPSAMNNIWGWVLRSVKNLHLFSFSLGMKNTRKTPPSNI